MLPESAPQHQARPKQLAEARSSHSSARTSRSTPSFLAGPGRTRARSRPLLRQDGLHQRRQVPGEDRDAPVRPPGPPPAHQVRTVTFMTQAKSRTSTTSSGSLPAARSAPMDNFASAVGQAAWRICFTSTARAQHAHQHRAPGGCRVPSLRPEITHASAVRSVDLPVSSMILNIPSFE